MWGNLRSFGESVSQLTQDVLLELNEDGTAHTLAEAEPEQDVISPRDTEEFSIDQSPIVLVDCINQLQHKLADRRSACHFYKSHALNADTKLEEVRDVLQQRDAEVAELRELLAESQRMLIEQREKFSSASSLVSPQSENQQQQQLQEDESMSSEHPPLPAKSEEALAIAVLQEKVHSSSRISTLTRHLQAEKRGFVDVRKMYQARIAELEDYVESLKAENQSSFSSIEELEQNVAHVMAQSQQRATLFHDEIEKMHQKRDDEVTLLHECIERLKQSLHSKDQQDQEQEPVPQEQEPVPQEQEPVPQEQDQQDQQEERVSSDAEAESLPSSAVHIADAKPEESLRSLEKELQDSRRELLQSKSELSSMQQELESAQNLVLRLRRGSASVERMKDEKNSLRSKFLEESQRCGELLRQLEQREGDAEQLHIEIERLRVSQSHSDATVAKLEQAQNESEMRQKSLKERSLKMAQALEQCRQRIHNYEQELDERQRDIDRLQQEQLERQQELERERVAALDELNELRQQQQQTSEDRQKLLSQIDELKQQQQQQMPAATATTTAASSDANDAPPPTDPAAAAAAAEKRVEEIRLSARKKIAQLLRKCKAFEAELSELKSGERQDVSDQSKRDHLEAQLRETQQRLQDVEEELQLAKEKMLVLQQQQQQQQQLPAGHVEHHQLQQEQQQDDDDTEDGSGHSIEALQQLVKEREQTLSEVEQQLDEVAQRVARGDELLEAERQRCSQLQDALENAKQSLHQAQSGATDININTDTDARSRQQLEMSAFVGALAAQIDVELADAESSPPSELVPALLDALAAYCERRNVELAELKTLRATELDWKQSNEKLSNKCEAMRQEYTGLANRMKQLQADCRQAFQAEEQAKNGLEECRAELQRLGEQLSLAEEERDKLRREKFHSLSKVESRHGELAEEIAELQDTIQDKIAVIAELNTQLEQRTQSMVEMKMLHKDECSELAQRVSAFKDNASKLRDQFQATLAARDKHIESLESELRAQTELLSQLRLDAEATSSLADDYSELQRQHSASTQECSKLTSALANLEAVLDQFQQERQSAFADLSSQLEESRKAAAIGRNALQDIEDVTTSLRESEDCIEGLELRLASARKYALQLESDNATLKRGMEETMHRLKNFSSDENLVDRRIVNKLLVAYFDHHATDEVLQLMAKLLQFSDDERRKVIDSQRSRGVFGSLTSFLPRPFTPEPNQDFVDDGEKNIADLWVKFLLEETGNASSSDGIDVGAPPPGPASDEAVVPLPDERPSGSLPAPSAATTAPEPSSTCQQQEQEQQQQQQEGREIDSASPERSDVVAGAAGAGAAATEQHGAADTASLQ